MYRVKSNALWHSLPGVVAAYQPIAAPDSLAAQQNVAHGGARFGVYTATPGTAPTWSAATGWTFNGTTQHLIVTATATIGWSILVRFSNAASTAGYPTLAGAYIYASDRYICYLRAYQDATHRLYANGSYILPSGALVNGVMGISRLSCFLNGMADGTITSVSSATAVNVGIGVGMHDGVPSAVTWYKGSIQSFLLASRPFSPAEMWLASRQMAYCDVNPDWNAWARRRRYYYAPSAAAAAAFNPAWARNTNILLGGGFD